MPNQLLLVILLLVFLGVIVIGILLLDKKLYARRQERLIIIDDKGKNTESNGQNIDDDSKKYVFVPNIKIWAFSFIVGLVILFTPIIYYIIGKLFDIAQFTCKMEYLGKYAAWHYVAQIFSMLLIIGFVGLVAYMIIKTGKEE